MGVSPGFFKAVGLSLERGRLLDDRSLQEDVIVVDRAWASRFFPDEEVLGRRLHNGGCTTCPWTTVVGVVENVKWTGLDAAEDGTVYFPFVDLPNAFLVLRTAGDPAASAHALQQAVHETRSRPRGVEHRDRRRPDGRGRSPTPRYLSVLVGMFAITALVLSVVGVYGVMAYFVQQHTRDIGIRLALGGEPGDVRRLVIVGGLKLVVAGVAVGVGAAVISSHLIRAVLFEVSPTDPRAIVGVAVTLVAIAAAACFMPARQAARLDPAQVLRDS